MAEAAFAKDLTAYFDWLYDEVQRRAAAQLAAKAAPDLYDRSFAARLFRVVLSHLGRAARTGIDLAAADLENLFGFNLDWTQTNTKAEQWARRYSAQLVKSVSQTTRQRLAAAVANYVANEDTFGDLSREINGIVRNQGRAAMIAQTEITRTFAKANTLAWQDSGIVQGKQWRTSADELVCPLCGKMDQRIAPLDRSFGVNDVFGQPLMEPPYHPNCRCWVVPVSKT